MSRQIILLLIFVITSNRLTSQQFDFNRDCKQAYEDIISLRLQHGELLTAEETKRNPTNLLPLVLENYVDFFKVFISEDASLFDQLKKNKEKRLSILEKVTLESPMCLWAQATINLQWAFARMKFGEYHTAAFELRRAFIQLEENEKQYPDYLPNKLLLGLLHAMVGSIPDEYQWIVKLASMNGSVNQGIGEMKEVLIRCQSTAEFNYLREEAMFFLGFAELNLLADPDESFLLLSESNANDATNLLMVFLKATIEMRTGKNDKAAQTLRNRPKGEDYFPFNYLNYLEAETMLRQLDVNARNYYQEFIITFKGLNYRQDAIRKLAWIGLLNGDTVAYRDWIGQVPKQLSGQVDADKQAEIEAKGKSKPTIDLLKARLLFDGGYYQDALRVLTNAKNVKANADIAIQLEYLYRFGRVFHELNNYDKAIDNYQKVIDLGSNMPLYYAANAALKSGEIYEVTCQRQKAISYYNLCLKMKPDAYRSGIHQKAKAGLSRLNADQ